MTRFLVGALLTVSVVTSASAAYDARLIYVLEQLRHCRLVESDPTPMVGGKAIGPGGAPHEFYLLFPYVFALASPQDLVAMLHDKSPVIRIMGVKCVLNRRWPQGYAKPDVNFLLDDQTLVFFADVGCRVTKRTVGTIVNEMKKDPELLGDPKEPNKSPEPTAMSVTPPAAQESRQP